MNKTLSLDDQKLTSIIDADWDYFMEKYPEFATMMGDNTYNDKLADISEEAFLEKKDHHNKTLNELEKINHDNLSEDNKLNYLLFKERVLNEIREIDFKGYLMPLNQMMGVQEEFSRVVELMPYKKESDYKNYLSRLKAFPKYANQLIELMRKGLSLGVTTPRPAIIKVVDQIRDQLPADYKESVYYIPVKNSTNLNESLKKEIETVLENDFFPAFRRIADFLEIEYVPNTRLKEGLSEVPNGKAYYDHKLRTSTTTDLTAQEVHDIGLSEVARILKELQNSYKNTGFEGSYEEFLKDLKVNTQHHFASPKELMMTYRDIAKRADKELPRFFKVLPRLPYGVEEIPHHQAPSYPTAYYLPPDLTMTRAGIFYANTSELTTRPNYEAEELTLHEAVP
ncbi:MAG: DUF885 domain-containing protein, partial [Cyanobacteriota bacterium]